ncbi:MAG: hypothetical protein D6713_00290 [Deltaproteobacteria bacterium]|nr:MAG: hypothetical protein D6713_00290 [Deltaproteobacteria bacterium]
MTDDERKLLRALYLFYKEIGPCATPNLKGLDEEAGLTRGDLETAVRSLASRGLIEYWELGPAVRLTVEGLELIMELEGDVEGPAR